MPSTLRRKRWWILPAAVAVIGLSAWFVIPPLMAPTLERKLSALVAAHFGASLRVGALSYRFPYTVVVRDAQISARGGADTVHFERAVLTLDTLPVGSGPLLIRFIELDSPTVRISPAVPAAPDASEFAPPQAAPTPPASAAPSAPEPVHKKLSEMFHLRRLTLRQGKLQIDTGVADAAPMVWENISTELRIDPRSASLYGFNLATELPPLAAASVQGTIDIDALLIDVTGFQVRAHANPDELSASIPQFAREFIERYQIAGAVEVSGTARVDLRDPHAFSTDAVVRLRDAAARPMSGAPAIRGLNAAIAVRKPEGEDALAVRVDQLAADLTRLSLQVTRGAGTVDLAARTWRMGVDDAEARLTGQTLSTGSAQFSATVSGGFDAPPTWHDCSGSATLHDLRIETWMFPRPITAVRGSVRLAGDALQFTNLSARYGDDELSVAAARMPLSELPDRLEVFDLDGAVVFHAPTASYPGAVGSVIAQLKPTGRFQIRGAFTVPVSDDSAPAHWDLHVATDGGSFLLSDRNLPLTSVRGSALITRESIEIAPTNASMFDGTLTCSGTIDPRGQISYHGRVDVGAIDVDALAQWAEFSMDGRVRVVGRGAGTATFDADRGTLDALRSEGEFSVNQGRLWELPILKHVASRTKVEDGALNSADAAAVFSVADGRVHLKRAAVYSAALGLQGSGTVDFGGELDLDVVAAPLGDWERHIRRLRIPLIGDVAGGFAGAMQRTLNTATSSLLYEFHITGTARDPHVTTVPAPVLTHTTANLFGHMLRREKPLSEALHEE